MIFSRGGGSGGRHAADEPRKLGRHSADRRGPAGAESRQDETRSDDPGDLSGPYDIADAPAGLARVDLGSLRIPTVEGVEVRVQANTDGVIQQVVLAHGESALQLGVFAAPRTEGIWDEVRAEIRTSLLDDGVAVEEITGDYGKELRARVRTPDGMMDVRFIGVDGPRWMLRAVYQGRAAIDPSAAGPLAECVRGLVVDRGREAMPLREALPLRLPREIADQAQAQAQAAATAQTPATAQTAPIVSATRAGGSHAVDPDSTARSSRSDTPFDPTAASGSVISGAGANGSVLNGSGHSGSGRDGSIPDGSPAVADSDPAEPRRRPSPRPR